jgi:hypothetical protein
MAPIWQLRADDANAQRRTPRAVSLTPCTPFGARACSGAGWPEAAPGGRDEMREFTPDQRRRYAQYLCEMIQEWIGEGTSPFEFEVMRGVEWCTDARSGLRTPRPNPSFTVILKINGGAQDSEGPPILPTPALFREPDR